MNRRIVILSLLFCLGLLAQVSITKAVSDMYTWQIDGLYSKYEIDISTKDHWKTDTPTDVIVRLILVDKDSSLDHTKTNWMQVRIKSPKFIVDSERQTEAVNLASEGDYWEKIIPMQIPSSKLEQGENVTISLAFTINIDEFDNVQHKWWNHEGSSTDDPIYADVTRPLPMFWETVTGILVIGLIVIIVGSISGFMLYRRFYRRRTTSVKPPSPPIQ